MDVMYACYTGNCVSFADKIKMQNFAVSSEENTQAMIKVMDFISDLL